MANLTPSEIAQYAYQAGFRGVQLVTAVAVALAESGGNPLATNTAGNSAGTDRGLFQINSYYQPQVTSTCAFDPACNARAAYAISSNGTNFTPWSSYNSGAYAGFLTVANGAVSSVSGVISTISAAISKLFNAVFGTTITQTFGCTSLGIETPSSSCPSGFTHLGVDYAVSAGTQLPSLINGTVTQAGWNPNGYGNSVTVSGTNSAGQTVSVLFGHLQSVGVSVGQAVGVGTVLGLSGSTGVSTGPHLHVGQQVNGQWVDPTSLINSVLSGSASTSTSGAGQNIAVGLPVVGGAISGIGDLLGKLGASLPGNIWGSFLSTLGENLKTYLTSGLILDPLFVYFG
ncbi:MAG: hypothetical protein B7X07_07580, partial [Actinobacteria bacterium 21-64-8]